MLIRFNVKNFLSFSEREDGKSAEFAMIAGKVRNKKAHVYDNEKIKLLKFAAIYGANAAGKSNLVKALDYMRRIVLYGLPKGHTDMYCKIDDANKEKEWLNRIITERLTVRQLDQELKKLKENETKSDIPLVDLSFNAEDIKNNSFDINKNHNKLQPTDDILKDYSEDSSDSTNVSGGSTLEKNNVENKNFSQKICLFKNKIVSLQQFSV